MKQVLTSKEALYNLRRACAILKRLDLLVTPIARERFYVDEYGVEEMGVFLDDMKVKGVIK